MPDYNKILLIQTAFLGDAILTTPLIRALKETYPNSELDLLTIPQSAIVFKHNPHINRILLFDKRTLWRRIPSFLRLLSIINKAYYDLAVSAHLSIFSSLLMAIPGIPVRLGFPRQRLLTKTIQLTKGIPLAKRYLELMSALTEEEFSAQTKLYWEKDTEIKVDKLAGEFLTTSDKIIGIAPGSIWHTKRWPAEYYAELITLLRERNVKIVLIGGKDDIALCKHIFLHVKNDTLNLAGKLSITDSAALINRLKLVLTNDSAPMHIANAVETDVIAIFGPTVERFGFFPFRPNDKVLQIDIDCRPCGKHGGNKCPRNHFRCMRDITPKVVFEAVMDSLEQA